MNFDYYKEKVFDFFWNNPNTVFPNFDFYGKSGKLYSNTNLNGDKRQKAKIVVNRKFKNLMPTDNDSHGHTSNGGGGVDIVEFYRDRNNLATWHESLKALCALAGVDLPTDYKNKIEDHQRKQSALDTALTAFQKDLFAESGAKVLDYLTRSKASGGRGYDMDTAKKMKLGAVTAENLHLLNAVPGFEDFHTVPALAIPLERENVLCGFKVRYINRKGFYNAKDQERNKDLYYLPCWNREDSDTEDGQPAAELVFYCESLFICESETDALHARAKGMNNVCCLSSRSITDQQISKITAKGYKNVIFCLDTEDGTSAEDQAKNQKANEKALFANIRLCIAHGLNAYYLNLPAKDYTEKVDFDSYFNGHELTDLTNILFEILKDYGQTVVNFAVERYGTSTSAQRASVKSNVFAELSGTSTTQTAKALGTLATALSEDQAQTAAEFREYADRRTAENQAKEKAQKDQEFRNALAAWAKTADTATSTADNLKQIQGVISAHCGHFSNFAQYTHNQPKSKLLDLFALDTEGIKTGYYLQSDYNGKTKDLEIILPAAALTTIAAPTGHGKSKFLQNIILNVVKTYPAKRFLYFNFEESITDKLAQLMNNVCGLAEIYHDRDNNQFIKSYLRTFSADPTGFLNTTVIDKDGQSQQVSTEPLLINAVETVFNYIESDNIIIFAESPETPNITDIEDIEKIIIENANTHGAALGGVFLDYLQLVTHKNFSGATTERLEDICKRLQSLAIKYNIPIVICSQLQRGAKIYSLRNELLSDSKGIENTSNTVIMLYNSVDKCQPTDGKGQPTNNKSEDYKDFERKINNCYNDSFTNFFEKGYKGRIYARCTKARSELRNACTVFNFEGKTGKVTNFDKNIIEDPADYKITSPTSQTQNQEQTNTDLFAEMNKD